MDKAQAEHIDRHYIKGYLDRRAYIEYRARAIRQAYQRKQDIEQGIQALADSVKVVA